MRCAEICFGAPDRTSGAPRGPLPTGSLSQLTGSQRMLLNQALLAAQAAASPPKGLLGLFGSPPKTWLRRGNSHTKPTETPQSLQKAPTPTSSPSKPVELSHPKPPSASLRTPTSSPAKARLQSSASRMQLSGHANDSQDPSPSKSNTRSRSTPTWASLYSLDVSLEEKGGKGGAKST